MLVSNFNPLDGYRTKRELTVENGLGTFKLPANTVVRRANRTQADHAPLLVDAEPTLGCVIYGVRIAVEDLEPIFAPTRGESSPP